MTERDLATVQRAAQTGALDVEDPSGEQTRSACIRLLWLRWKRLRPGGWDSSGFREWSEAEWSECRLAHQDDPSRAAVELARRTNRIIQRLES